MKQNDFEKLEREINKIKIVDTHEHLQKEKNRIKSKIDPFKTFLSQYISSDLISSGMSYKELSAIMDDNVPLEERWEKLSPYWDDVQNTAYAKSIRIAIRDLYSIDRIEEKTIKELARKMNQRNKKGLYKWVLKDKAGIEIALQDTILKIRGHDFWNVVPIEKTIDVDRSLFAPVHRFHDFILITERTDLDFLSKRLGYPIHSLEDLLKAFRIEFERLASKIYAVKVWIAYRRSIFFDKTTYADAEKVFNEILRQRSFKRIDVGDMRLTVPEGIAFEEAKPLQDFMVHEMIRLSIKHRLPIQIHTGFHEGNENIVENSNPMKLVNLFLEYKEAKFDIFHGGYPFLDETAALVKNFPNVYVDFCWLHLLAPSLARRVLYEWLDSLPSNKILGFGGDYVFVEGSYGHSIIARQNIASVLKSKLEEGSMNFEETKDMAKKLLRDNAIRLFFQEKSLTLGS